MSKFDRIWRIFATGLSFSVFGLGGVVFSLTIFFFIHVLSPTKTVAHLRCQYIVHQSFRSFIWLMKNLGVRTFEISNREKLHKQHACLIVANHPSLIDIVFLISLLPHAQCVVKKAVWSNPFMAGVMWATGYIPNNDPERFIEACVGSIERGQRLVIFPEGTRTVPGQPMKLKRGAATIIGRSCQPFIPITITSDPPTLTKGEKWYQIPPRRVHFQIVIGDEQDPASAIIEGENPGRTNRRINRILAEALSVNG